MSDSFEPKWHLRAWGSLILLLLLLQSASVQAWNLLTSDVSSGYSQCSWKDNGNGTTTFGVTISFKDTDGRIATARFLSRGILVYTYDKSGNLNPSSLVADYVVLNGVKNDRSGQPGAYAIYMNLSGGWNYGKAFTAQVEVTVQNKKIAAWPAISIQAANYTSGDDVGEKTGGAYVGMGNVSNSDCVQIKDPTVNPPPPPPPLQTLVLKVTAPDWNLGELPRGDSKKMFTDPNEMLCFETFDVTGDIKTGRFVINAGNDNGRAGSSYLLRNLADPSQTVPYWILLNNATTGDPTMLPNDSNISVPLYDTPRNCFIPTFSTSVGDGVKGGTYSDVLKFTVVTKP
ncbi:hypothetical protein NGK12_11535 [Raoultella ornithinolytica]|uniref:hypothetical protein n=1 Tax=Raoultella ornithinolytica TaxID=54291 RepID=UPI002DBB1568|nr:hypothetical protein [Raoultella ornithinolytica]MEB7861193.1 hypothetical protein [Raoultella ornithinolytica]MEB7983152.1 hypothetical protein [Raoultella ornithinolytica]